MTSATLDEPTTPLDDDRHAALAWLGRRLGLGLSPDDATALAASDDPVGALVAHTDDDVESSDPWDGDAIDDGADGRRQVVVGWATHLLTSPTPYVERRTQLLHGWLVTSLADVPPAAMAQQVRLFRRAGGGSFPDLLRAITTDAAMLLYLDGFTSVAGAPNENYGRELLELFSLGTGDPDGTPPYDETDVRAAAVALTGWTVRRGGGPTVRFVPRRHDDTPQTLLGTPGVHDVDTVVDAIVAHPEHDRFVARRIAAEIIGVDDPTAADGGRPDPDAVATIAAAYRNGGRHLDRAVDAAARLAFDGRPTDHARSIVLEPAVWLAGITRTLGLDERVVARGLGEQLRSTGQVPMYPPTVAGWPGGTRWLTTGALVARTNIAAALAEVAVRSATAGGRRIVDAAADGDVDRLAVLLGLRGPFSAESAAAIRGPGDPASALALALVAPEYLVS